jgi:hypothetical protein
MEFGGGLRACGSPGLGGVSLIEEGEAYGESNNRLAGTPTKG